SFFFYYARHHRHLHSFPTRRSSDLGRHPQREDRQLRAMQCASGTGCPGNLVRRSVRFVCIGSWDPSGRWPLSQRYWPQKRIEMAGSTLTMTQQSNGKTENPVTLACGVGNTLGTSALWSGTPKRLAV